MITELERKRIIDLIHQEVVPAIGCTEPIAVALCVAKATETLGMKPEKINVLLSANILKNAMGVGIPGTGMIGLPIAIALGALIGKSDYQLEVLKDSTPDAVEEGKRFIEEKRIHISLKENIEEKLYIEICCEAGDNRATAVIAGGHTTFIYIEHNGEILLQKQHVAGDEEEEETVELSLRKVYDFALNGNGFFCIQTSQGIRYTRNGSFSVDKDGYLVLNQAGRVLNKEGQPVQIKNENFTVDSKGHITAAITNQSDGEESGSQEVTIEDYGTLKVVDFPDQGQLHAEDNGLFSTAQAETTPADTTVQWKMLEKSNVDMVEQMTAMMSSQRALQSAAQSLKMYDQIMSKSVSDVGKL